MTHVRQKPHPNSTPQSAITPPSHPSAPCRDKQDTCFSLYKQDTQQARHVHCTCSDEDRYLFDWQSPPHLTAGLFPSAHRISSRSKKLTCEAQKRKGRLSPTLSAENGNLFLDHSRLRPRYSTRFVAIELLIRFEQLIHTCCYVVMILRPRGSYDCPGTDIYSWSSSGRCCRTPRTPTRRDTAIPSSFDHPSAVKSFYVTDRGRIQDIIFLYRGQGHVCLVGRSNMQSFQVFIPTRVQNRVIQYHHRSYKPGCFSYHNKRLVHPSVHAKVCRM